MKNQQKYQIEQIETGSLIPYARNAKKHDAAQVAKIAGSIREFGFNNPVLIDSENGHLFLFLGIGPQVWERLLAGASVDGLVNEVGSRYGAAAAAPTRAFLDALEQAEMLRNDLAPSAAPASASATWPEIFVAPTLERYDQIADIISMDPIHEVDPSSMHRISGCSAMPHC